MGNIRFKLSINQSRFVSSQAHIVQINGPMGEGKTYAGVAGAIHHAWRNQKNIRGALIRDTFQNIKTSTIPDLREILKEMGAFSDGDKKLLIRSTPSVELDLFGIDDQASISKLQGPQYAFVWLEEPAPIYEKANAGLPKEAFNMAVARSARQKDTIMRVQITQNPADEEHWTSLLAEEPEDYMTFFDEVTGEWITIRKETFWMEPGENKFLSAIARAANRAAFKGDKGKWARYVLGRTAIVPLGKEVTPRYNQKFHYSDTILPTIKGEFIQMWDSWQNPTCIIGQF